MRRSSLPVAPIAVAAILLVAGLTAACSRDHSLLAPDPGGGGGAAASVGAGFLVSAGVGGGGGDAEGAGAGPVTTSGATGTGGGPPPEPDGEPRLVVVHGLVDRPRIAMCFATPEGAAGDGAPWPPGGLRFATATDVDRSALPEGADDVVAHVVAGAESDLEDARCDLLLGDPAGHLDLEVAPLGAVPRSAIDARRVLALITAGCLGGDDEVSDVGEEACGVGFGPGAPTAMLVAVSPSRHVVAGRVALQAIGGSVASAPFDVVVRVGADGAPHQVADEVSLGAALPVPPDTGRDAVALSAGGTLEAQVLLPGAGTELAVVDLGAAMDRSGVPPLEDGRGYAIVFVGPAPTLGPGPFWPAFDAAMFAVTP